MGIVILPLAGVKVTQYEYSRGADLGAHPGGVRIGELRRAE
jgi:hypothetical protein